MMKITGTTTVRDLLTAYPEASAVLRERGMCANCETAPPPVPLDHFASKHCNGDVAGLIDAIEKSLSVPPA